MQPHLNNVAACQDRLGVGRSTVFNLIATKQLRSVKIGSRRLVPEAALVEYIASLESTEN